MTELPREWDRDNPLSSLQRGEVSQVLAAARECRRRLLLIVTRQLGASGIFDRPGHRLSSICYFIQSSGRE
jgi:hypothetical protein